MPTAPSPLDDPVADLDRVFPDTADAPLPYAYGADSACGVTLTPNHLDPRWTDKP